MKRYYELDGFNGLYLEDSYVLGIFETANVLTFEMEFVLLESHPLYRPAASGEQYCYRRGNIRFSDVSEVEWARRSVIASKDSRGEIDYGNIDLFEEDDGVYMLSGDWGEVRLKSAPPSVDIG